MRTKKKAPKKRPFYYVFKLLIKNFDLKKKITEKKLVSIYQNFIFSKKLKGPNLIDLIKKLVLKKKIIMIVTEGNYNRQKTKIKLLKFLHIFGIV